jgi:hypothetical protein
MAWDLLVGVKSFNSTNALASQFVFVEPDPNNANSVILPQHAGDYCIGVTQDTPSAGDPTAVCGIGSVTKVLCAGTFAIGQAVTCDINGNAVAATSSTCVLGIAVTAGAAGFLADILYQPVGATGTVR